MPRIGLTLLPGQDMLRALLVAADALRESPENGEVGPWDDLELHANHRIEVSGSDRLVELVALRLRENGFGIQDMDWKKSQVPIPLGSDRVGRSG